MTIKLDAIARNQSIPQFCQSFSKAPATRQQRMRPVLNAAQQQLRKVRRHAVLSLARAVPDVRASLVRAIDCIGRDIRTLDRTLNAEPSGTLADVWPCTRRTARR